MSDFRMAPRTGDSDGSDGVVAPEDTLNLAPDITEPEPEEKRPPFKIVWRNVILMSALHLSAIYGLYLIPYAKVSTLIWSKYKPDPT
jgi:stearoyl-CoA desaturase (delta-9 desaturase)